MAKKRREKQQQKTVEAAAAAQPPPPSSEDVNDSDDEEIDEDEAFNSEDERKYGIFFQDTKKPASAKTNRNDDDSDDNDGDDNDEESDSEGDDNDSDDDDSDDEEGDGGQFMLDLLDKLGNDGGKKKNSDNDDNHPQMVAHVKESAYSSSVVPSAGLTMDALMQDLKDTKGFGALTKTMKVVTNKTSTKGGSCSSGNNGATLAPLPRVQSDRLQRQIGYSKASDKMTREWIATVQENRKAETLDFRAHLQQETLNKITANTMVETFTPTTDFEKEIHQALQEAGQLEEESILQAEQEAILKQHDDLGHAELTVEDLAKRRAQLAKMRALMFYHEQKRHHMNKIKSKKYRRIRKRQAERLKQADLDAQVEQNPDLEQELQEKEHVERMKERMTLAHKNTSKWAKRILKRSKKGGGSNVDVDTRRALSAQLKRGDDLLQKMKSRNDNDDESSSDDDNDEDLVETARQVLADAENEQDGDDDDNGNTSSRRSGLFKLAFMQRGIEKQKQQAREEARQLLEELKADRELEQDNDNSDNDDDDDTSKPRQEAKKKKTLPPPVASRQELKDILKEGGEMTTSRSASSTIAVSGNIQIDIIGGGDDNEEDYNAAITTTKNEEDPVSLKSEHTSMLQTTGGSTSSSSPPPSRSKNVTTFPKAKHASASQSHNHPNKDNENDNPWLAAVADNDPSNRNKKKSSDKKTKNNNNKSMVDVDRAVDLLEPQHASNTKAGASTTSAESKRKNSSSNAEDHDETKEEQQPQETKTITRLSQEELVRRAFASTSAQDAEDEFAQEKAMVEEREDPLYKKKLADQKAASCKGWGSWAGKGAVAAPPPQSNKRSLPPHLQPPAKKKQKLNNANNDADKRKRRDGGKDHLIIRERRVKRMADQYMLHQVPYPYACRQDYERAMAGGIGPEWNVTQSVKDLTRPEICTRAGKIIEPLSQQAKTKKRKNPISAKF